MELKEFVKETLVQITEGVRSAQDACYEMGGLINPMLEKPISNSQKYKIDGKYYPSTTVSFTVGLTESNSETKGGGIGVSFSKLTVGVGSENEKGNQTVTSVEFSITVVFPYIDRNGKHIPRESIF